MYIKILACILVVGGFSIIGFYYSFLPTYRKNDLIALKRAILLLLSEMKFLSGIKEALINILPNIQEPIASIFRDFYVNMEKGLGEDIEKLWEEAISSNIKRTYFKQEDIQRLSMFAKGLSSIDKDFNMESLNMILEYIDRSIEEIEQEKNKNSKMYQSLGVLSGLMVIILLV